MSLFFFLASQGAVLRKRRSHSFSSDVHSFSSPVQAAAPAPGGEGNLLIKEVSCLQLRQHQAFGEDKKALGW